MAMVSQEKIVKFPHRRSIGSLYIADESQPEEWQLLSQVRGLIVTPENQPIKWDWLEEARGSVRIPAGKKLKLKMSGKGSGSLSPLSELDADDLHTLDLSRSEVQDLALTHIEHLNALKVLELTATNITDEAMPHLQDLEALQGLGLSHCQISGRGVRELAKLTALRELWLSGADIRDEELESITVFKKLVQLGMSGTRITNDGLLSFACLKELVRVYVFNTGVTKEGADKLRKLVPSCRAKWNPARPYIPEDSFLDDTEGGDVLSLLPEGLASMLDGPTREPVAAKNGSDSDFWHAVDLLDWDKCGDDEQVIEPAVDWLSKKSEREIISFANVLSEKLHRLDGESFARNIGLDAYQGPNQRFSRNWFLRVRCCVVANGQEFFQEVLTNPSNMPKDLEFEAVLRIAPRAYERKTGQRMAHKPKYNYETFANKEGWHERPRH
jgi:hypothetical protein